MSMEKPAGMPADLKKACSKAQHVISTCGDRFLEDLYSSDRTQGHYWKLTDEIERIFGRRELSLAAFLHGVRSHDVERLVGQELPEGTVDILRGMERLYAITEEAKENNPDLVRSVLDLVDPRSAFLMLYEQLHHLDPNRSLATWSAEFAVTPRPVPRDWPESPFLQSGLKWDTNRQTAFARTVLVPLCEYYGLRSHRRVAEDAVLWYRAPKRFRAMVEYAVHHHEYARSTLVGSVMGGIQGAPGMESHWEWDNVGSFQDTVHEEYGYPRSHLPSCGRIVVKTDREGAGYETLSWFHGRYKCRTMFEGEMGDEPSRSARTIQLTVYPNDPQLKVDSVLVEIVRDIARRARGQQQVLGSLLDRAMDNRLEVPAETVQVFTPDGGPVVLGRGATVLNYTKKINNLFIGRVRGALVNFRSVDLLHVLRPGDVVTLQIDMERVHPLPWGWEKKVPKKTVKGIRKQFLRQFNPELERRGAAWLYRNLNGVGIIGLPAQEQMVDYLRSHEGLLHQAQVVKLNSRRSRNARWLMRQLGLYATQLNGERPPVERQLSRRICRQVLDVIIQAHRKAPRFPMDMPKDVGHVDIKQCEECVPSPSEPYVGLLEDNRVVVHRSSCAFCLEGHQGPRYYAPQAALQKRWFILVETSNRMGIASDVLAEFKSLAVDIEDLVACRLGLAAGIFRIQIQRTTPGKIKRLLVNLNDLEGVHRAEQLGHTPDAMELHLPSRLSFVQPRWTRPMPYIAGPKVQDRSYFYGREQELSDLEAAFDRATQGSSVFIKGPRHIGKSSMLLHFLRIIEKNHAESCVTVYYEYCHAEHWDLVESTLEQGLKKKLGRLVEQEKVQQLPDTGGLAPLVEAIHDQLGYNVVLAIDEAVRLCEVAGTNGTDGTVVATGRMLSSMPGVLLCWCGPDGPVRHVPSGLQRMLRDAQSITLPPFDTTTVHSMLRAEKLSKKYFINVPMLLAARITAETGGNPYWVALVAQEMWNQARSQVEMGDMVEYDLKLYQQTVPRLRHLRETFDERLHFYSDQPEVQRMGRAIARLLARRCENSEEGLTTEQIHRWVTDEGLWPRKKYTIYDLRLHLEHLRKAGTLINDQEKAERWSIVAPLLANYILSTSRTLTHIQE